MDSDTTHCTAENIVYCMCCTFGRQVDRLTELVPKGNDVKVTGPGKIIARW